MPSCSRPNSSLQLNCALSTWHKAIKTIFIYITQNHQNEMRSQLHWCWVGRCHQIGPDLWSLSITFQEHCDDMHTLSTVFPSPIYFSLVSHSFYYYYYYFFIRAVHTTSPKHGFACWSLPQGRQDYHIGSLCNLRYS